MKLSLTSNKILKVEARHTKSVLSNNPPSLPRIGRPKGGNTESVLSKNLAETKSDKLYSLLICAQSKPMEADIIERSRIQARSQPKVTKCECYGANQLMSLNNKEMRTLIKTSQKVSKCKGHTRLSLSTTPVALAQGSARGLSTCGRKMRMLCKPNSTPRTYHPPTSQTITCLLYTSPSPRDRQKSRMPSSA